MAQQRADMLTEQYSFNGTAIFRDVANNRGTTRTAIVRPSDLTPQGSGANSWWRAYLRGKRPEIASRDVPNFNIIDLYSGCGGLSLGATEAIKAVGLNPRILAAVDINEGALNIYRDNLAPKLCLHKNANMIVDFQVQDRGEKSVFQYSPEICAPELMGFRGVVDLLLAGPPCQGHSNLNNHTRRNDPRNMLYLGVVATAVALKARAVIIENVPDIKNDKNRIIETAKALLSDSGYLVSDEVLNSRDYSCAQSRRRHFLVACLGNKSGIIDLTDRLKRTPVDLEWAIGDLEGKTGGSLFDTSPMLSGENRRRIDFLFDNDIFDLPNQERPTCHRNGHTYPSVYGRMKWGEPAQTITTGFMTPGRGRYIHPSERRVLTPHEGARIQGFPDSFIFVREGNTATSRNTLSKRIGDAVPPPLAYAVALQVISELQ
jgi:DNA (cytosine-5)-methyltransferase 1